MAWDGPELGAVAQQTLAEREELLDALVRDAVADAEVRPADLNEPAPPQAREVV